MDETAIDTKAQIIAMASKLVKLQKDNPWLISVDVDKVSHASLHIREDEMTGFAPLKDWVLNAPFGEKPYPYKHILRVNGVKIFAITADPIEEVA